MDSSLDHRLKLGDLICLFSEDAQGLVFTDDSSIKNNGLKVKHSQKENEADIPDVQVVTFQVQTENRYKLAKQYRKLKEKAGTSNEDGFSHVLQHAKAASEAEEKDNQAEQSRLLGRPIRYGDLVQLRHMFTDKYVTLSCKETSTVDKNKMLVKLDLYNSKQAQFRLLPGSKVKSEGDYIEEGDQIVLESMKSRGNFIHVTYNRGAGQSVCEVNCGIDRSVFTVIRHQTKEQSEGRVKLTGGSVIQFHHKDLESYIAAEGMCGEELQKDAHLRGHNFGPLDPRSLYPPKDPDTYWQVVLASSPLQGDNMTWKDTFYLRHMPTRLYLSVSDEGAVRLVSLPGEDTLLKFYTLLHKPTEEFVHIGDTIRILHIETGTWLYGAKESYAKGDHDHTSETVTLENVKWEKSACWQIKARAAKKYPDAFILNLVCSEDIKIFNYMVGLVPFLRQAAHMLNTQTAISVKDTIAIEKTLQELVDMSEPVKNDKDFCKQNTMRGTGVIDLLMGLLKTPYHRYRVGIFQVVYRVLLKFTGAQSLQNNIYCAPWLTFLKTQLLLKNDLGHLCCLTMIELIKNNRVVIDSIDSNQVAEFVEMTREHKHHYLLDLLSALCVCNDIAIIENQTLIAETMILHTSECLFHIQLGKDIGHLREKELLFISTDNRHTWVPLSLFVKPGSYEYTEENHLYLQKQMGLFKRLAFGHNSHILELLTNRKDILPWEVAFQGLRSVQLPDATRTMFCDVIIHLFVENAACLDRIHQKSNNFIYQQISPDKSLVEDFEVEPNNIDSSFPELKPWLQEFFDSNPRLIKSIPDRNNLIAEVMKLVYGLVRRSYMGSGSEIHDVKGIVMKYTQGIHDAPTVPEDGNDFSRSELREIVAWARTEDKYAASPDNDAIVKAKKEGLNLLMLLLEVQTSRRQKYFLAEFKNVHNLLGSMVRNESLDSRMVDIIVNQLDGKTLWMEKNSHLRETLEDFLKNMLNQTDFLGSEVPELLLEISKYDYSDLRLQSIPALDSYFSSKRELLNTTLRTQIITSQASEHVQVVAQKYIPIIQTIARTKVQIADLQELCGHLNILTNLCQAEGNPDVTYTMSQDILVNNGILDLMLELVTGDEDTSSKERKQANVEVINACFFLLRTLTRRNEFVQQWMFDHLHSLLFDTPVTVSHCALALQEIFQDNPGCCMKIDPGHIEKIVQLAGQSQSHEWITLLTLLVKDETTGTIFGRNQLLVIKMLMQNFEGTAYPMKLTSEERTSVLRGERGDEELLYFLELVTMLATCAQGESGFILSVSQKLLPLSEVLEVLTSDDIDISTKAPFTKYLVHVYLSDTEKEEFSLKEIILNSHLWSHLKYLLHFPADFNGNQSDNSEGMREHYDRYITHMLQGGFLLIQAMMEKLQSMEYGHLIEAEDLEPDLTNSFVTLCQDALLNVTHFSELHTIQECWTSVCKRSRKGIKYDPDEGLLAESFESTEERLTKSMNMYVHDAHEMDLNQKLRVFSQNLVHLIEGQNTVRVQLGVQDKAIANRAYIPHNSDVKLPLGEDFHRQVDCFVDSSAYDPTEKFQKTGLLIEWIEKAGKQRVEKFRSDQSSLHLKCIQILRALLYNQIRQLPPKWEENARNWQSNLNEIKHLQDTLDDFGLIRKVMPLMDHSGVNIGKHVMALIDCLLFNANRKIQSSIHHYFLSTREEVFFRFVRNRLHLATLSLKQRPNAVVKTELKSTKESDAETVYSTVSQRSSKANSCCRIGSLSRQSVISSGNNNGISYSNGYNKSLINETLEEDEVKQEKKGCLARCFNGNKLTCARQSCCVKKEESEYDFTAATFTKTDSFDLSNVKTKSSREPATSEVKHKDASETGSADGGGETVDAMTGSQASKSDVEVILRVLGGLCDGQNKKMQNHMRVQPDNVKSVNLVAELTHFVSVVYTRVTPQTIGICTELFNTLHEICEGNQENRATLIDNKIIDYINLLMRKRQFEGCDADDILDLKAEIGGLLYSLIEENGVEESETAMDVCQTMAVDDIRDLMTLCYAVPTYKLDAEHVEQSLGMNEMELLCSSKSKRGKKSEELKDMYEKMTDMGYLFYCILARLVDLKPEIIKKAFPFPLQLEAFNYFKAHCRTVEILKDGHLQKKHFRVKNQNLLREEIKEHVKWEVDRTSPTSKLRDLLGYSKDILKDIDYQKMIINNRIFAELAKKWAVWHYISVLLSLVITIIMLISWKSPYTAEDLENENITDIPSDSSIYKKEAEITVISQPVYDILMIVFGAIHCACSAMLLFCYLLLYHPVFPNWLKNIFQDPRKRRKEKKQKMNANASNGNDTTEGVSQTKQQESKLEVKFFSSNTLYYLAMPTMSVLGFVYYGYFYAFHLLGIVNLNPLLKGVIRAITYNGRSLIWVGILGVIVIYIYTLLAFAFFRESMMVENSVFCHTLSECFTSILRYGTIGDITDMMPLNEKANNFERFGYLTLFHVVFFIIFTTIGLNIIFGIIVDTFSEIRDKKWIAEQDMNDVCFICSKDSFDFEHHGKGFQYHVKEEHHMWNYVFYLIYLNEVEEKDYTSLDMYVAKLANSDALDFFPMNCALGLHTDEDEKDSDVITKVSDSLNFIENRLKVQEVAMKKLLEKFDKQNGRKPGKPPVFRSFSVPTYQPASFSGPPSMGSSQTLDSVETAPKMDDMPAEILDIPEPQETAPEPGTSDIPDYPAPDSDPGSFDDLPDEFPPPVSWDEDETAV